MNEFKKLIREFPLLYRQAKKRKQSDKKILEKLKVAQNFLLKIKQI